ncbi:MAG: ABC transporter substrate-binding protein [Saprospiraceae bacterium]
MKKLLFLTCLLGIGVFFTDCRTDPKPDTTTKVDFKHDENIVYARLRADADNLNPYVATAAYAQEVYKHILPYLMYFSPETLELTPILVKGKPEVKELTEGEYAGGISYTYEFLDEAQWDNGQTLTAEDVIFSFKVMFTNTWPNQRAKGSYSFVGDIQADENNPKRFTFFVKNKYILSEVQLSTITVLPSYIYDPNGILANFSLQDIMNPDHKFSDAEMAQLQQFGDNFMDSKYQREKGFVVGCGAYELEEWETGQRIILKKKENWWGDALADKYPMLQAEPQEIHYKIIADQTSAVAALRDQELDAIDQIQPKDYINLSEDKRMQELYDFSAPARLVGSYVTFNLRNPKLEQKEVRRAIAHLFDIDNIMENVIDGMGKRINNPIMLYIPDEKLHEQTPPIPFDVAKAKDLLTAAGWTDTDNNGIVDKEIDGEVVELELTYLASSPTEEQIGLLFQNSAKEVGVSIVPIKKEFITKLGDVRKGEYELAAMAFRGYPMPYDPHQNFHSDNTRAGGSNFGGYINEEVDELITQIRVEMDDTKRRTLYARFLQIINEDQPYVYLFSPLNPTAISKRFSAESSSMGYFTNMFELKSDVNMKN